MDWNIDTENKSKRHHYVPRFYLNNWARKDSEIVFAYIKNKTDPSFEEVSTKDICLKRNLYTRRKGRKDIEESFFRDIDGKASSALSKIISLGIDQIDCDERIDFSRFINTLHRRQPNLINEIREFNESCRVQNLRHAEEEFAKTGVDRRHFHMKEKYDDSPAVMAYHADGGLDDIFYAKWHLINNDSKFRFLTSDFPLRLQKISGKETYDLSLPEVFLLWIPLSPFKLLLISNKDSVINHFKKINIRDLVIDTNINVIQGSKNIIISSESGLERFVNKHITIT